MTDVPFTIRPITADDRAWMAQLLAERWGGPQIVTRGQAHQGDRLPGFIALLDDEHAGLITYHIAGDACEIVSLDSLEEGIGIGSALVGAVRDTALARGCRRLWLITTNDNLAALGFYQKRGFHIVSVHRNALQVLRRLKPIIPLTGLDGIPLRDEIELEMILLR